MKKALIRMGYRKMKSGVWGKPVGNHLLLYDENKKEFTNWFESSGKTHIWNSQIFSAESDEDFLEAIKSYECRTRLNTYSYNTKDFSFLTIDDYYNSIL